MVALLVGTQEVKRCCICKETKPLIDFYRSRTAKFGRATACKICSKARGAKWRAENRDRHNAGNRKYHQENRDWINPKRSEYYYNNREKILKQHREYLRGQKGKKCDEQS